MLSTWAFCIGLPGWMWRKSIFHSTAQARKCRLVSSGPLSQRIASGVPRRAISFLEHACHAAAGKASVHLQSKGTRACTCLPR